MATKRETSATGKVFYDNLTEKSSAYCNPFLFRDHPTKACNQIVCLYDFLIVFSFLIIIK